MRSCAERHSECVNQLSAADIALIREVLKALRQEENTLWGFEKELMAVETSGSA